MVRLRVICCFWMLVLLYSACAKSSNERVAESVHTETKFALDSSRYVILNYDSSSHWAIKSGKATELNSQELAVIEQVLEELIEEVNSMQSLPYDSLINTKPEYYIESGKELTLDDKYRQYVPVLNKVGEKEVWVNLFCEADEGWKSGSVHVDDGGSCFFNVIINVDQKSHRNLMINGDA